MHTHTSKVEAFQVLILVCTPSQTEEHLYSHNLSSVHGEQTLFLIKVARFIPIHYGGINVKIFLISEKWAR